MGRTRGTRIGTARITGLSTENPLTGDALAEEFEVELLPRHPVDVLRCRHCGAPLEQERIEPVRWTRTASPPPA